METFGTKSLITLPKTKEIKREPKGSELPPKALFVYRKDPTEYKQAFVETGNPKDYQFAGKPYKHTPIGEWWLTIDVKLFTYYHSLFFLLFIIIGSLTAPLIEVINEVLNKPGVVLILGAITFLFIVVAPLFKLLLTHPLHKLSS